MAKNDVILIDAIVDERLREIYPSNQRDEVFEFLAFEQVLKDFDLSREETSPAKRSRLAGSTGGTMGASMVSSSS
jgi:hypothetical protein